MHYKMDLDQRVREDSLIDKFDHGILDGSMFYANIIPMVVNREKNREYLQKIPWRTFLDLAVIYRFVGFLPGTSGYGVIVDDDMMKEMNMTEPELYQLAMKNMNLLTPVYWAKLAEEMKKIMPREITLSVKRGFFDLPLYLLTNSVHLFGASAMLCQEKIAEVAAIFQQDLYVLPSSVHEILLLPADFIPLSKVRQVVKEVNDNIVEKEEWLSDQVYLYCREKGEIEILPPLFH